MPVMQGKLLYMQGNSLTKQPFSLRNSLNLAHFCKSLSKSCWKKISLRALLFFTNWVGKGAACSSKRGNITACSAFITLKSLMTTLMHIQQALMHWVIRICYTYTCLDKHIHQGIHVYACIMLLNLVEFFSNCAVILLNYLNLAQIYPLLIQIVAIGG